MKRAQSSSAFVKKTIIFGVVLCAVSILFNFLFRRSFLTLFIVIFVLERVYESFFTRRKTAKEHISEDLHLKVVVKTYTAMIVLCILEFYLFADAANAYLVYSGVFLLLCSFLLRWKAISEMEGDWAIDTFAIPSRVRTKNVYAFMRHPYYIGVLLEAVSLNLILGTWMTLLFSTFLLVPFELRRAYLEEQVLSAEFGWDYIRYKREVNRFFPTLFKRKCYDRRSSLGVANRSQRRMERRKMEMPIKADRRRIV